MKVGILGYGSAGQRHALIAWTQGHEVAVYDPSPQVGMDGPRLFQQGFFGEMHRAGFWEWGPEAVIVASPVGAHAMQVWEASQRGVSRILVEKPLAMSMADFWNAPQALGLLPEEVSMTAMMDRVSVGYQLRCHAGAQAFAEIVRACGLGDLYSATFCCAVPLERWLGDSYSSALLECSHELDAARWILGPATVVGAVTVGTHTCDILLRHELSGVSSAVHLSYAPFDDQRYWRVSGSQGEARIYFQSDGWTVVKVKPVNPRHGLALVWEGRTTESWQQASVRQLECWLEGTPACGFLEGVGTMVLCDQAAALARKALPIVGQGPVTP